jgi:DNA-directed RNA polymerase specialized sigma24 family protein
MPDPAEFHDLIHRVRSGDQDAATDLVRLFEPYILRVIRIRMRERADFERLRHEVSSADICQSVFTSLFVRLKDGRFELDHPDDLTKLLTVMARLKIATKARRSSVRWRDVFCDDAPQNRADSGPGPEKPVDDKDLSEAILRLFSLDDLEILNRRLGGETWSQIAETLGGTPDARRHQLERAIDLVRDNPEVRGAETR